ncbi:nucleotidyltransferase family protein [Micromonospora sp. WMMD1120]|uniref:nucleotidyltransferase family protein n=1 Tax=Micromonospora sp. WMMD1120 TaxID=3016106 RepID=UPI0024178B16|nr:nucleotidyltransferase family protein [Micromonospora sp. WMMD1120]MDG4809454.1 nucleotidyltransferase family protein [Micromonospora sp. WMMD1120]
MSGGVGGVLLAAGAGRRYGLPKALAVAHGQLFLEIALAALRDGGCHPVVVVLGAAADRIRLVADLDGATVVVNRDWSTGMGSSLRVGLHTLRPAGVTAAVVQVVDTPGVSAAAVARLAAHAGERTIAAATYRGRQGHPVLLGRAHWPGVTRMAAGDTGARPYLVARARTLLAVPCDDLGDGVDVDRPAGLPDGSDA